jgi:uncharacterized protein DUF6282
VESFGAVVLNRSVGGLDPCVAEAAIHFGAKVVWMPSNHSKYHADFFNISDYPQFGRPKPQLPGEDVTVFEDDGATLTRAARTICEVVAENGVALATGHLSLPALGGGTVRVPREDDEGQPGGRAGARSGMDAFGAGGPSGPPAGPSRGRDRDVTALGW